MAKPLKEVTSTIPIVAITDDPVNAGLVPSLAHPGGNITGASVDAGLELWSKRLQLFRGVIPTMKKVGVLGLRPSAERAAMLEAAENAQIRIVGPSFIDDTAEAEYRRIFAAMSQEGAEALFVGRCTPTPFLWKL
jgi:putative ABC transport system substrate-binding protein